jgi:RES domain
MLRETNVPRRYPLGDIKILWALSAGRCCFPGCREICIAPATSESNAAALGDIAHVVAHSPTGPRGDENFPEEALDTYANWILLCPTHHRLVDSQPLTYDVGTLLQWKREHETWVTRQLRVAPPWEPPTPTRIRPTLYRVVRAGSDPWETPSRRPSYGRWDDPQATYGVRYAADSPEAAIAEATAHLQPAPPLLERMTQFFGKPSTDMSLGVDAAAATWLGSRVLAKATVSGAFASLDDRDVRRYLESQLDPILGPRGSAISLLADMRWTQQASRVISRRAGGTASSIPRAP